VTASLACRRAPRAPTKVPSPGRAGRAGDPAVPGPGGCAAGLLRALRAQPCGHTRVAPAAGAALCARPVSRTASRAAGFMVNWNLQP